MSPHGGILALLHLRETLMKKIEMEQNELHAWINALILQTNMINYPCSENTEIDFSVYPNGIHKDTIGSWHVGESCVVYGDGCPGCLLREALCMLANREGVKPMRIHTILEIKQ